VDGAHVQGVAEDEGDLLFGAEVGEPVPAEQALDGHDQSVAEGGDGSQEGIGIGGEVAIENEEPRSEKPSCRYRRRPSVTAKKGTNRRSEVRP
jgi:hypothetical protein